MDVDLERLVVLADDQAVPDAVEVGPEGLQVHVGVVLADDEHRVKGKGDLLGGIPGSALTEGQKYGTLELAKIENMRTQYEDVAAGKASGMGSPRSSASIPSRISR